MHGSQTIAYHTHILGPVSQAEADTHVLYYVHTCCTLISKHVLCRTVTFSRCKQVHDIDRDDKMPKICKQSRYDRIYVGLNHLNKVYNPVYIRAGLGQFANFW